MKKAASKIPRRRFPRMNPSTRKNCLAFKNHIKNIERYLTKREWMYSTASVIADPESTEEQLKMCARTIPENEKMGVSRGEYETMVVKELKNLKIGRRTISKEMCERWPRTANLLKRTMSIADLIREDGINTSRKYAHITYIGKNRHISPDGMVVLALSGGGAKGVFYIGFLEELFGRGIYPDIMIGSSAGGMAVAAFGSGMTNAEIRKMFSKNKMKRIFSPWKALIEFILSIGSGLVGRKLRHYLKKVFGNKRMNEIADVMICTTVQWPENFGTAIFGTTSETPYLRLGSNIRVRTAVHGSCAIQGIVSAPKVKRLVVERVEKRENGSALIRKKIERTALEDGASTEYLPIRSADAILSRLGRDGMIVAVNLSRLGHMPSPRVKIKRSGWRRVFDFIEKIKEWMRERIASLAPIRAYRAYESLHKRQLEELILSFDRPTILINPNSEGELDNASLFNIGKTYDFLLEEGRRYGRIVAELLNGSA